MLEKSCHITIPHVDYPQVYADLMRAFRQALDELDISVTESTAELRPHCLNVIFAPWGLLLPENELLFQQVESLAEQCALFNMEQPHPESRAFTERMIRLMRRTFNFDYYPEHNSEFQRAGCAVSTIRFLWHPSMRSALAGTVERDIDLLFVGAYTDRRIEAFSKIEQDFGLKVTVLNDVWGRDVDAGIARSKVAINIKGNANNPSFEVLRCLPMIANGAVVVSENNYENIYEDVKGMVQFCDLADIGRYCHQLLKDPDLLETTRQKQYQILLQTSFLAEVQRGWTDWMQWLAEPLHCRTICYEQLDLSQHNPEKWRYDTLYLHDYWLSGALAPQQPLRREHLEHYVKSKESNMCFEASGFKVINTRDHFARVVDPVAHMHAWAQLLFDEGRILLSLPYYLSPIAYDYPTYLRPCSEESLNAFIGKQSVHFRDQLFYFDLERLSYLPTDYGASLLKNGTDFNIVVHTPNAIRYVEFVLVKRIALP